MGDEVNRDQEMAELNAVELEDVSGGKSFFSKHCEVCGMVISSAISVRNNGVCDACKKEGRSAGGASGGW